MSVNRNNLFSSGEAVYWSGLRDGFSPCNLHRISTIIYKDICACFGEAFFDYLIEHLVDYSGIEEYNNEATYNPGDVVCLSGFIWQAVEAVSEGSFPTENNACWSLAPKFDIDCLNDFWCNGSFARYLSYIVVRASVVSSTVKLTNAGAVISNGEGYQRANENTMRLLQAEYSSFAQAEFNALESWIYKNKTSECFECTKQIGISCCKGCGCQPIKCRCDTCDKSKTAINRIIVC